MFNMHGELGDDEQHSLEKHICLFTHSQQRTVKSVRILTSLTVDQIWIHGSIFDAADEFLYFSVMFYRFELLLCGLCCYRIFTSMHKRRIIDNFVSFFPFSLDFIISSLLPFHFRTFFTLHNQPSLVLLFSFMSKICTLHHQQSVERKHADEIEFQMWN